MATKRFDRSSVATAFLGQFLSTDYFVQPGSAAARQSEQLLHQIDLTGLV